MLEAAVRVIVEFQFLSNVGDGSVRVPAALEIDSSFEDALWIDVAAILRPGTSILR